MGTRRSRSRRGSRSAGPSPDKIRIVATSAPIPSPGLTPVLREESRVTPLELFFDLVFVLALTQCTALMADDPTWSGLAKGILVLGVMDRKSTRLNSSH